MATYKLSSLRRGIRPLAISTNAGFARKISIAKHAADDRYQRQNECLNHANAKVSEPQNQKRIRGSNDHASKQRNSEQQIQADRSAQHLRQDRRRRSQFRKVSTVHEKPAADNCPGMPAPGPGQKQYPISR